MGDPCDLSVSPKSAGVGLDNSLCLSVCVMLGYDNLINSALTLV